LHNKFELGINKKAINYKKFGNLELFIIIIKISLNA